MIFTYLKNQNYTQTHSTAVVDNIKLCFWGQFVILDNDYITYFSNYKYNQTYKYRGCVSSERVFTDPGYGTLAKYSNSIQHHIIKPNRSYKDLNMLQIIYETQFDFDEDINNNNNNNNNNIILDQDETLSIANKHREKRMESGVQSFQKIPKTKEENEEEENEEEENEENEEEENKITPNISGFILLLCAVTFSFYIII